MYGEIIFDVEMPVLMVKRGTPILEGISLFIWFIIIHFVSNYTFCPPPPPLTFFLVFSTPSVSATLYMLSCPFFNLNKETCILHFLF
jgi:hypothetical protein